MHAEYQREGRQEKGEGGPRLTCSLHISDSSQDGLHKGNLALKTSEVKMTEQCSRNALIGLIVLTLPKEYRYNPKLTEPQFKKQPKYLRKRICKKTINKWLFGRMSKDHEPPHHKRRK